MLGEKSANASLTPSRKRFFDLQKPCSTEASPKPLHEFHELRTVRSSFSSQSHAGQKRTIDEVEGNTRESEPRKALMTAASEVKDVATFENTARMDTAAARVRVVHELSLHLLNKSAQQHNQIESSASAQFSLSKKKTEAHTKATGNSSRIPTDPDIRKRFVQQVRPQRFTMREKGQWLTPATHRPLNAPNVESKPRCVVLERIPLTALSPNFKPRDAHSSTRDRLPPNLHLRRLRKPQPEPVPEPSSHHFLCNRGHARYAHHHPAH